MKQRSLILILLLCFGSRLSVQAQMTEADTGKLEMLRQEASRMISFWGFALNTLGDPQTPLRDKETIIFESYSKIFLNEHVQIEDDLIEGRSAVTNKDVQAYLKDVDFFFQSARFAFTISEITHGVSPEGTLYFRVETVRALEAIDNEGDTLRSMLPRIFEINSDPQGNLKIASIYTTGLGEDDAIINWWNGMPLLWKRFLGSYVQVKDSMTMADVLDLADSARIGEILHYEIRDAVFIDDSLMLRLFGDASGELSIGDSAYIFHTDTLDLSGARLMPGLRRLLALQSLDLSAQSDLWDLEPLSRMNSLRELTLYGESISDLTPLRNLTRLERLNISNTRVESLSPLQYAIFLRELNCKNTPLADIEVFSRFRQLQSVDISSTQVSDLRPLASLTQLRELRIRQVPASDLSPLSRLTKLELLDVSASGVADLGPVSGLSQLQALYAEQTSISDLQPLQSLPALRVIYLEGSKVSDLSPIGRLPELRYIYCDYTPVTPAEAVRFIRLRPDVQVIYESDLLQQWWTSLPPAWKSCFQSKSQVKPRPSSEELHRLTSLPQLNVQGLSGISSLEPLRVFARLEGLNVSGIPISDLTPLSGLLGLEKLNISQTNVASAGPLRFLLNLTEIDASGTAISDLSPLSDLHKLRRVSLDNTPVQNLLPLGASAGLTSLYCDNTRVGDSAAGALLDKLPSLLICYQTPALEAWWAATDKTWRDILMAHTGAAGEKPSREALHRILLLSEIQLGAQSGIQSLAPVSRLFRLQRLSLTGTAIRDISPIQNLPGLRELILPQNPISDITPIARLKKLRVLDLSNTPVEDLTSLAGLTSLEKLSCSGTPVRSLKALSVLTALRHLDISNTGVSSLNEVAALPSLSVLRCFNTRIPQSKLDKFASAHPNCEIVYY